MMSFMFERARPVWLEDGGIPNVYAEFLADFEGGTERVTLLAAADSHYAVYVNDTYVYAAQFADDHRERVYDEIDISACVRPGRNKLRFAAYCTRTNSSVYLHGGAYAIFEVFCGEKSVCFSAPAMRCRLDRRYAMGQVPLITGQMGYTFSRDDTVPADALRLAIPAMEMPVFVPRPIRQCALEARRASTLVTQGVYRECGAQAEVGQRMQKAFLAFREREEMGLISEGRPVFPREEGAVFSCGEGDGMYFVFDLGRNDVGLMDIELTVPEKTEILIGWGEHLDDLRVRSYVGMRNFLCRWVAGAGRSRFFHPFRRIGGRYLQIFIKSSRAAVHYVGLCPVRYPLERGAALVMDDALHRKIHETCLRTLEMYMHEHYEDCPWREQALYAMDSRNQMLIGYYAFGEYAFPRASLRTLGRTLRADGLLELCAPARVPVDIPSFTLIYLVQMWEYLLFSGDDTLAREMMPVCRTIIDTAAARRRENGLVPRYAGQEMWNFYEWSAELDGGALRIRDRDENRFDAPLNAFLVLALDAYAKIHDCAGSPEEACAARRLAEDIRQKAHGAFYDAEKGYYATYLTADGVRSGGSELTQALCVCAGICPDDCLDRVLEHMTDGTLIPVTLAYTAFQYDALMKRPEKYGSWVRRDVERQWGGMLYQNATSFWETIVGAEDFERAGSLCHGWSAVPTYLYYAYGVGIRPTKPGWADVEVCPAVGMPAVRAASVRLPDGSVKTVQGR